MKALSLAQPWASLTVTRLPDGRMAKMFETRSFRTHWRGPVAIHASKSFPGWCKSQLLYNVFNRVVGIDPSKLPTGAILGICNLTDCFSTTTALKHPLMTDQEALFGDYTAGRFAWLLEDMRPFKQPVPAKGALGLWQWEPGCTVGYLIEQHCEPL
jgi:hypothetical protein